MAEGSLGSPISSPSAPRMLSLSIPKGPSPATLLPPDSPSDDGTSPRRGRSFSFTLPGASSPTGPKSEPSSPGHSPKHGGPRGSRQAMPRGKYETRKLLLHLLDKVTSVSQEASVFGGLSDKGKQKAADDDDEDVGKGANWVERVVSLMVQLRDVLIFSDKQGWNLFYARCVLLQLRRGSL
jgi:hypothetical protein